MIWISKILTVQGWEHGLLKQHFNVVKTLRPFICTFCSIFVSNFQTCPDLFWQDFFQHKLVFFVCVSKLDFVSATFWLSIVYYSWFYNGWFSDWIFSEMSFDALVIWRDFYFEVSKKKSWNQNVWFSWPTGGDWSSSFTVRALVHSLEQSDRFNLIFGDGRTLLRKKKVSVEKLVKTRELKFSKGKSAGANWLARATPRRRCRWCCLVLAGAVQCDLTSCIGFS